MTYEIRDTFDMYLEDGHKGPGPELMSGNTMAGEHVHNKKNEHLGDIKEFMLDMRTGKVAYAVLSFGGVSIIGEKLFAVPFSILELDTVKICFALDVEEDRFENGPGFDSNNWQNMADQSWSDGINDYYALFVD
jgi:sporulation protein YlmC with PRC-barrel domain